MKNLPFDTVPLQFYKNTFLQRVAVELSYPRLEEKSDNDVFYEELGKYLSLNFGIEIDSEIKKHFWNETITLSRKDDTECWMFGNGVIVAIIGTKDYHSFVDSMLPNVYKMKKFIEKVVCGDEVSGAKIRKANVWQFNNDDDAKFNLDDIRSAVLSESLLKCKTNVTFDETEKKLPNFKKIEFKESNEKDFLIIRHFCTPKDKEGNFALFLDTERECKDRIDLKDLEDILVRMNKDLFDAYHWCVNSQIIKIMSGESE